jgi:transcriptional regulator GlxA family with amidase domain
MASICTGSFVLAAGGFLEGRRATTHWRSADDFRRMFPHIELDPNVLFTDCHNVLTLDSPVVKTVTEAMHSAAAGLRR